MLFKAYTPFYKWPGLKEKKVGKSCFYQRLLHLKLSVLYPSQNIHPIEIWHLFLPSPCTLVHNLFALAKAKSKNP